MVDLRRQYQKYKTEIDKAVLDVVESGFFINGPDVKGFAQDVQDYLGVQHAIPCASGTDALQLALMAIGVGPGDEVITTPFTFVATAETIALLGAKPVYVDIDEKTYNINPAEIEAAITAKTKAIIPVHLYGQPADMDAINEVARKHHLKVVEDAAQALGARYKDKPACTFGDMSCISFFPSKNLGAYGDAGMVVTDDGELAETLAMIANHGSKIRYEHQVLGINSRLDSIQAAVLRVKLQHLDEWNARRREIADFYTRNLEDLEVVTPFVSPFTEHIYHQFTIQVDDRDALQTHLNAKKIPNAIHYPIPLHLQPAFRNDGGYQPGDFPVSEAVAARVISLPMHPDLNADELNYIVENIRSFLKK